MQFELNENRIGVWYKGTTHTGHVPNSTRIYDQLPYQWISRCISSQLKKNTEMQVYTCRFFWCHKQGMHRPYFSSPTQIRPHSPNKSGTDKSSYPEPTIKRHSPNRWPKQHKCRIHCIQKPKEEHNKKIWATSQQMKILPTNLFDKEKLYLKKKERKSSKYIQ